MAIIFPACDIGPPKSVIRAYMFLGNIFETNIALTSVNRVVFTNSIQHVGHRKNDYITKDLRDAV